MSVDAYDLAVRGVIRPGLRRALMKEGRRAPRWRAAVRAARQLMGPGPIAAVQEWAAHLDPNRPLPVGVQNVTISRSGMVTAINRIPLVEPIGFYQRHVVGAAGADWTEIRPVKPKWLVRDTFVS